MVGEVTRRGFVAATSGLMAIVAYLLMATLLGGCAASTGDANAANGADARGATASENDAGGSLRVVCATFPAYDWVREVAGERFDDMDVKYLMGSGVDLHNYQPTVEDIAAIADADLFVYVGGESDGWAAAAVQASGNEGLRALSLLDAVGSAAVEEELVEGMQDDDEVAAEGATADDAEYDEHVWLSLRNAQVLVTTIADELSALDPHEASVYAANADAYCARLAELDAAYAQVAAEGVHGTVVFADRFPFRYLLQDYGLDYYAAFSGCSAATEASFETVAFLAQKVDELGLGAVLTTESSDGAIARTVADAAASSPDILVMDSLQSVTQAQADAGMTYLGAMELNLDVLAEALRE